MLKNVLVMNEKFNVVGICAGDISKKKKLLNSMIINF
jgi:hypothetical protein